MIITSEVGKTVSVSRSAWPPVTLQALGSVPDSVELLIFIDISQH